MTLQTNFHSQVYSPADLAYQDCVVKSGIAPDIYPLNFDPASGSPVYGLLYCDTDPTTNSGISIEAARNLARCTGSPGYFLGNNFYLPSDLAGNTKAARYGIIKSKGIYRPEGPPAYGWISNNRFRQLGGAPIALDQNKSTGVWEPRRYHQPKGKPLEIFFPRITVRVWKLVAEKAGLSMPEFPVVGVNGEALQFWEWVKATNLPDRPDRRGKESLRPDFSRVCSYFYPRNQYWLPSHGERRLGKKGGRHRVSESSCARIAIRAPRI
jgi:hypothetical protein